MYKITEKEIYEAVKGILESSYTQNLSSFFENKKLLSEGLTMTYAYPRLKEILKRKYDLVNIGCVIDAFDKNKDNDMIKMFRNKTSKEHKTTRDNDSWFEVTLFFQNGIKCDYNTIKDICHTMDACGWYYAGVIDVENYTVYKTFTVKLFDNFCRRACSLVFYPKFNKEFKPSSLNNYCYHICPLRSVDRIMKQGLTPRSNGRVLSHPERVYLFLNEPKKWKSIANRFKESGQDEKYVLLSVYIGDLIENGIKFYSDANTMTDNPAVYTYEPIPPNNIEVVDSE